MSPSTTTTTTTTNPPAPAPSATTIFTRATLHLAKTQRLINSWLPPPVPPTPFSLPPTTNDSQENEKEDLFTAEPEVLGVGATTVLPKDGDMKRDGLSSNEALRRQLLGRDYKKKMKGRAGEEDNKGGLLGGFAVAGGKPRPLGSTREVDRESGDEEEGRSSLGKPKRKRRVEEAEGGATVSDEEVTRVSEASMGTSQPQKRAINYLDQVLAEKSRRQRKKSRKRKKHDSES